MNRSALAALTDRLRDIDLNALARLVRRSHSLADVSVRYAEDFRSPWESEESEDAHAARLAERLLTLLYAAGWFEVDLNDALMCLLLVKGADQCVDKKS